MERELCIPHPDGSNIPICLDCANETGAATVVVEVDTLRPCTRCNNAADSNTYGYVTQCPLCGLANTIFLNASQHRRWSLYRGQRHIQDILPEASAGLRESLISGAHEHCFDAAFGEFEEPDVEDDGFVPQHLFADQCPVITHEGKHGRVIGLIFDNNFKPYIVWHAPYEDIRDIGWYHADQLRLDFEAGTGM